VYELFSGLQRDSGLLGKGLGPAAVVPAVTERLGLLPVLPGLPGRVTVLVPLVADDVLTPRRPSVDQVRVGTFLEPSLGVLPVTTESGDHASIRVRVLELQQSVVRPVRAEVRVLDSTWPTLVPDRQPWLRGGSSTRPLEHRDRRVYEPVRMHRVQGKLSPCPLTLPLRQCLAQLR